MSSRLFTFPFLQLWLILASTWGGACAAQADTSASEQILSSKTEVNDSPVQVSFGLAGVWKLGQLCPVRVQLAAELQAATTVIEIQTVDGDGVDAIYRQPLTADSFSRSGVVWIPIRIGRQQPSIEVRLLGNDAQLIYRHHYEGGDLGRGLPSSQPLIVALGSSMGVESLSRSSADGSSATFSTVRLESVDEVPPNSNAYSSCDLLLISGGDRGLLSSLDGTQWSAVDRWIRQGGACIICLGDQDQALVAELEPLMDLLPGPLVGVGRISNPGALESLVATEDPLADFGCVLIEPQRGRIELALTDSLSRAVPWWLTYSHGLGTMRFVASDLDQPAFEDWVDRQRLWGRLIAPYMDRAGADATEEQAVGEASYLGYNDMVGQLRATLDLFPQVGVISFGQVAALLVGVLLLIGPIDYFVSVKWLKRPELSWVLAGTILVAVCVGLTLLLAKIRPSEVHLNSAQIVDIDVDSGDDNRVGIASGRLWSHVFSGSARELDIAVAASQASAPVRVDWQGLPGHGLGGLLSQLSTDRGMPAYTIESADDGMTKLLGVGIPAAGTKCLTAQWTQPIDLIATSHLQEIPGVDQLQGELANPLSVDVLDPVLFYHHWFYSLNSRIPAGESVRISYDTIPKDISRRLNGRRTVDGNETTTKWDPADRESIDRLLELMMFYKSASGKTYTSLAHRFQPQVDQSNLLQTDRAILLGRLERPWAAVQVALSDATPESQPLEVQQDMDRVWCRIVIPVEPTSKK
ncbi:MAG: hypothetical protein IT422_07755 [Pirellulaceae bacterium]|jgi:hypothetical protein|nr:hypothetical protein [Pirellulaceae bacterium]